MIIGIDATNIRSGGGVTHLMELLNNTDFSNTNITKIHIWSNTNTLSKIRDNVLIIKKTSYLLNSNAINRFIWKTFILEKELKKINCDVLFVPGSLYYGSFRPYITIFQNVLPFDKIERRKFFPSYDFFRLSILKFAQIKTFEKASGLIFLTQFAKDFLLKFTDKINAQTIIIPHGISDRFNQTPKKQFHIDKYSKTKPFKFVYVSIVTSYKYQIQVIEAFDIIRKSGYPVTIEFVGGYNKKYFTSFQDKLKKIDPTQEFIKYIEKIDFSEIHKKYMAADAFIFASSCENLPNIMIEAMSSGLPILSSNLGPMPEVLKNAGYYFDPKDVTSIVKIIEFVLENPNDRYLKSIESKKLSKFYNWQTCSSDTFEFFNKIISNK